MAAKKKAEVKKLNPETVDRLGQIQHEIAEKQLEFNQSIAELVKEEKTLSTDLRDYIFDQLGDKAKATLLTPEEAEVLIVKAESVKADGETYQTSILIRNTRVLDDAKILKKIGQKKWNEISSVTIKDLGGSLGTDEIDQLIKGFKPVVVISVKPV